MLLIGQPNKRNPFFDNMLSTVVVAVFVNQPALACIPFLIACLVEWDIGKTQMSQATVSLKMSPIQATYEVMKMRMTIPLYWIDETLPLEQRNDPDNLVACTFLPSCFCRYNDGQIRKEPHQILNSDQAPCIQSFGKKVTLHLDRTAMKKTVDVSISTSRILQLQKTGLQGLARRVALQMHAYFPVLLLLFLKFAVEHVGCKNSFSVNKISTAFSKKIPHLMKV